MTPKKTRDYNKDYYSRPEVKEAHAKYMKEYYRKHKEHLLEKQSKYYVNNKDKIKVYMKTYMRNYKPSKKLLLGKDVIDPKSQVVNIIDKDKV